MMILLYLAAGGAAGTLARYGTSRWVHSWAGYAFPWGTLTVNVLGSLLLGIAIRLVAEAPVSAETRGLVMVGFCGAFTTFSTFSYEAAGLLQQGSWGRAALYAFGSVGAGLLAVAAGMAAADLAQRLLS